MLPFIPDPKNPDHLLMWAQTSLNAPMTRNAVANWFQSQQQPATPAPPPDFGASISAEAGPSGENVQLCFVCEPNVDNHAADDCPTVYRFPCRVCGAFGKYNGHFARHCPRRIVTPTTPENDPVPSESDHSAGSAEGSPPSTGDSTPSSSTSADSQQGRPTKWKWCVFCANLPPDYPRELHPETHTKEYCPILMAYECPICKRKGHTVRKCPDKPVKGMDDPDFHRRPSHKGKKGGKGVH